MNLHLSREEVDLKYITIGKSYRGCQHSVKRRLRDRLVLRITYQIISRKIEFQWVWNYPIEWNIYLIRRLSARCQQQIISRKIEFQWVWNYPVEWNIYMIRRLSARCQHNCFPAEFSCQQIPTTPESPNRLSPSAESYYRSNSY